MINNYKTPFSPGAFLQVLLWKGLHQATDPGFPECLRWRDPECHMGEHWPIMEIKKRDERHMAFSIEPIIEMEISDKTVICSFQWDGHGDGGQSDGVNYRSCKNWLCWLIMNSYHYNELPSSSVLPKVNPATLDSVARLCRICGTPNPVIFRWETKFWKHNSKLTNIQHIITFCCQDTRQGWTCEQVIFVLVKLKIGYDQVDRRHDYQVHNYG